MLNTNQAQLYLQQLHPAFAGYLHDGEVTTRDALATIIHFINKGYVDPVWKDNSMHKGILGLKRTTKAPQYSFEQQILNILFNDKNEVSAKDVGKTINSGQVQQYIKQGFEVLSAFPIVNNELNFDMGKGSSVTFSMNGRKVDTVEEAAEFNKTLKNVLAPVFILVSIFLVLLYFGINKFINLSESASVTVSYSGSDNGFLAFLLVPVIFMFVLGVISASFYFSNKKVTYDFADIVPVAKAKYDELFEFIKSKPLPPHTFTNELLAFSIAFGLDNSWFDDFGLDGDVFVVNA